MHQTGCAAEGGPELLLELQALFSIRHDVQINDKKGKKQLA